MKNKVTTMGKTVKKYFHSAVAKENEKHILDKLQVYDMVPEIYDVSNRCIEMAYLPGMTLSELIDRNENNLETVFKSLIDWIKDFNSITGNIVLEDMNLKNFIFSNNKIYGIDFECWHRGDNKENYAAVLAAVQTAYFKDEDIKKYLYEYVENLIDTDCSEAVQKQIEKINLRRRAMKKIRNTDCVIISGGKSIRMGFPKGLLNYNGHTFIDHIIYNTAVFDRQYISANNNLYNDFNCKVINDRYIDIGPMSAVHSGLTECENEYVFFIPCDMPFITEENIFYLFDTMDTTADAVVFTAKDRTFPTVGIYRKSILPQLEKQIESGNYKMMKLLESIKTQYVQALFPYQFENINTPEDYKRIKQKDEV